ncbi:hypothetical protein niasHT_032106 [Heterodera trifolii]|uniref:Uncharacterized protein n=1 Tax=Heterodera trifolii TaxID=157864 RepID=A0ABD2HTJ4_9BILA
MLSAPMHGFGLFLSLFAAINLSRSQISPKGSFLMANKFLETGKMLFDKLQNQTGNEHAENEADDELKSQKANGKALETKSDNFQQKAFGFLCGIEMKAQNDEKANDKTKKVDILLLLRNFCQNWKNKKIFWEAMKKGQNVTLITDLKRKMDSQIFQQMLQKSAKMENLNPKNQTKFEKLVIFGIDLQTKLYPIFEAIIHALSNQSSSASADQTKGLATLRRRKRHNNLAFYRERVVENKCAWFTIFSVISLILFGDLTARLANQHLITLSTGASHDIPSKHLSAGWKEAGISIVTSVNNLKLNQQIYGESLRTLAKMESLNSKNKKEFGNFAKFSIDLLKKVTEILKDARMSPQRFIWQFGASAFLFYRRPSHNTA